jgi:hypothetical protein
MAVAALGPDGTGQRRWLFFRKERRLAAAFGARPWWPSGRRSIAPEPSMDPSTGSLRRPDASNGPGSEQEWPRKLLHYMVLRPVRSRRLLLVPFGRTVMSLPVDVRRAPKKGLPLGPDRTGRMAAARLAP